MNTAFLTNPYVYAKTIMSFIRTSRFIVLIVCQVWIFGTVQAQQIDEFETSGTYTVPAGVTQITVECWGGGGAGGSARQGTGGGGAGGTYVKKTIQVTQGSTYSFQVGAIKEGSNYASAADNKGNPSWFGNESTVYAEGGNGGGPAAGYSGTAGIGSTEFSIGTTMYRGGNGDTGSNGGAGGGGAGSTGIGGNASTGGFGTPEYGGNGGPRAGGNNSNGYNGYEYGGGGSGAKSNNSNYRTGGDGAQGRIRVTTLINVLSLSVTTTQTCLGSPTGTGTITVTATGGSTPYQYSINGGTYQISNVFTGLTTGSYNVTVRDGASLTASTTATITQPAPSTDDQTIEGMDEWIGHMYDGIDFNTYMGSFTETEEFDESFGGATTCFEVSSGNATRNIYTETFSVKYRMNSSKRGLYVVDLGSDDGSRLSVDGTIIYNNWSLQAYSLRPAVLMNLNGNSSVLYEYYENASLNQVVFQELTPIILNTLTTNNEQTVCIGGTALAISGDVLGTLPSGITVSGTGYQWTYSSTPDGARVSIAGATAAAYTPNLSIAPFNTSGTYYIYRNVTLTSSNNTGFNPITLTNESNAAVIISGGGSTMPAITAIVTPSTCPASLDGEIIVTNIPVAIDFDKANSTYVDLGGSLMNNLSQFTIEGWVKLDKSLISGDRTWGLFGQNDAIEFGIMNSSILQLWSANSALNMPMSQYPDDNEWHHLAGVGTGTGMTIYIDGEAQISNTTAVTSYGASAYHTVIGGHVWDATGNYFIGSMIKVSFWSRALSVSEIAELASTKFTQYAATDVGLIAGYNFFEGEGNVLSKLGSAPTNGTLVNSPQWREVFTFEWAKTGEPSFTANTKNISLIPSGEYTLMASFQGMCPTMGTWTVGSTGLNLWTGTINDNWNIDANWTCSVPDITTDAVIPSALSRYPTLNALPIGACKNLTIHTGASLIVNNNTLQIAGSITNMGSFTAIAGTIEMKGTEAQVIPENTFTSNAINNLTINNAAGVSLNGTLAISGILKAQTGNLHTGGFLTLLSNASQTALIDGSGTGDINGDVTMQRYLPSAFGYKYFSTPFNNAVVGDFSSYTDLAASFATFYHYNENKGTTGWVAYVNPSASLIPGTGYAINFGSNTPAQTISTSGTVNNGNIGPFTLYNHDSLYTKGFNLVGNPYPSPVDWNASGWTKTNVDNAIYYFDAGNTDQYLGTYSSYINGMSSNGIATNTIASQQGFFVHVSDGAYPTQGTLAFTNQTRVNTLNPAFHKNTHITSSSMVRLSARMENTQAPADYMVVYFDEQASVEFDSQMDALKLMNTDTRVPNIYSLSTDNRELSIHALPVPLSETKVVNLGIATKTSGTMVIKAEDINNLPTGYDVYLKDHYTGKIQNLLSMPEYRFSIGNETFTDRFTLIFSTESLSQEALGTSSYNAYIKEGSVYLTLNLIEEQVMVIVSDLTGKVIIQTDVYGKGDHRIGMLSTTGVYIVSIYTDMGIISKKVYLK